MKYNRILALFIFFALLLTFTNSVFAFDNERAQALIQQSKGRTFTPAERVEALKLACQYMREAGDYMVQAAKTSHTAKEYDKKLTDYNRKNMAGDLLSAQFMIDAMSLSDTSADIEDYRQARAYFSEKKKEANQIADKKFGSKK